MRARKTSLALVTIIAALAGACTFDSASAAGFFGGGNYGYLGFDNYSLNRAAPPSRNQPGARSRPPSSGARTAPSMGGRGMIRNMGGGRMNGGMGRR
jgi:hypothetical protein